MIGATLHTVTRAAGTYDAAGEWTDGASERFDVYGCLEQVSPAMLDMDPGSPTITSAWRLILDSMERPLTVASPADSRPGDRVEHNGKTLAVVGMREAAPVGGLPGVEYHLIQQGEP